MQKDRVIWKDYKKKKVSIRTFYSYLELEFGREFHEKLIGNLRFQPSWGSLLRKQLHGGFLFWISKNKRVR